MLWLLQEIFGKIAAQVQETVTEEVKAVYGELYFRPEQAAKRQAQIALADSPQVTTDAIEHALFSPFPHTRYVVANFSKVCGPVSARHIRPCSTGLSQRRTPTARAAWATPDLLSLTMCADPCLGAGVAGVGAARPCGGPHQEQDYVIPSEASYLF